MKRYPEFYVWGRATHVGQCYEGFCATTIAAVITGIMQAKGATALELNDLKPEYNVQTPSDAYALFETEDEPDFENIMKEVAATALKQMLDLQNERRKKYCDICNIQYDKYYYDTNVLTLAELEKAVPGYERQNGMSSLDAVIELFRLSGIKTPSIVVFENA